MKIVATADLHIHKYTQFNEDGRRLKNCLKVLKYLFAVADTVKAQYILFAGDLFHQQKHLSIEVINETVKTFKELFKKYEGIEFICISGNHDYGAKRIIDGPVVTSCEFLDEMFKSFTLVEDAKSYGLSGTHNDGTDEDILIAGISDYYHSEDFYTMLERADDADILMVHATAMGYSNFPGTIDPKDERFKRFPLVISGDIHEKKWLADNFLMLGSPIHNTASDEGDDKGLWILDTDDLLNPEFISLNEKFPTFIRKVEGDKISPDEKKDYILWQPLFKKDEDASLGEKKDFNKSISEEVLVKNFYEEVGETDEEKLSVGLKLIK